MLKHINKQFNHEKYNSRAFNETNSLVHAFIPNTYPAQNMVSILLRVLYSKMVFVFSTLLSHLFSFSYLFWLSHEQQNQWQDSRYQFHQIVALIVLFTMCIAESWAFMLFQYHRILLHKYLNKIFQTNIWNYIVRIA